MPLPLWKGSPLSNKSAPCGVSFRRGWGATLGKFLASLSPLWTNSFFFFSFFTGVLEFPLRKAGISPSADSLVHGYLSCSALSRFFPNSRERVLSIFVGFPGSMALTEVSACYQIRKWKKLGSLVYGVCFSSWMDVHSVVERGGRDKKEEHLWPPWCCCHHLNVLCLDFPLRVLILLVVSLFYLQKDIVIWLPKYPSKAK